jgi:hypothetical protein
MSGFILQPNERDHLIKEYDIDEAWIKKSVIEFSRSPVFGKFSGKPLKVGDLYWKPPSARSEFQLGVCNDVRSTLQNGPCGLTREWTLISPFPYRKITKPGDSGSAILDKDYNVAAMVWGGDEYPLYGDLTFATPFGAVIEDIERRMGWEPGSCVWVGGAT